MNTKIVQIYIIIKTFTWFFRFNTYRYMTAVIFIRVSAIHNQNAADGVVILPGNYINNLNNLNELL